MGKAMNTRVLSVVSFPSVLVFKILSMSRSWSILRLRAAGNPSTTATRFLPNFDFRVLILSGKEVLS